MPAATGPATTAELRLAYALRKLRAFTRTITELQTSEFPHPDSEAALKELAAHFARRLEKAERVLPEDPDAVDETLDQVNATVRKHTALLGFILRSTNVRNAFETYFPLQRLVRQIIHSDARLVTSAEWEFVPFTYPMNIASLPDFVLVGGPAPEAGNTLIVPLAGHEIGHSAWRAHNLEGQLRDILRKHIVSALHLDTKRLNYLLKQGLGRPVQPSLLAQTVYDMAIKQLEEVFCDFIGTGIFGESYLWAFEYFLAPGASLRSPAYPSGSARIKFMRQAAASLGVEIDSRLFHRWNNPSLPSRPDLDFLQVTDAAVDNSVHDLGTTATKLLQTSGVQPPDRGAITRVLGNFERMVPDGDGASLAEIITAGWEYLSARRGLANVNDDRQFELLNELMLKSIEVSEYLVRVKNC